MVLNLVHGSPMSAFIVKPCSGRTSTVNHASCRRLSLSSLVRALTSSCNCVLHSPTLTRSHTAPRCCERQWMVTWQASAEDTVPLSTIIRLRGCVRKTSRVLYRIVCLSVLLLKAQLLLWQSHPVSSLSGELPSSGSWS